MNFAMEQLRLVDYLDKHGLDFLDSITCAAPDSFELIGLPLPQQAPSLNTMKKIGL